MGTNASHQERNSAASPELFTTATTATPASSGSSSVTAATPVRRKATKVRRPAATDERLALFATTIVVTATTNDERFEDLIGTNAPRQERNSAAHPELWSH